MIELSCRVTRQKWAPHRAGDRVLIQGREERSKSVAIVVASTGEGTVNLRRDDRKNCAPAGSGRGTHLRQ